MRKTNNRRRRKTHRRVDNLDFGLQPIHKSVTNSLETLRDGLKLNKRIREIAAFATDKNLGDAQTNKNVGIDLIVLLATKDFVRWRIEVFHLDHAVPNDIKHAATNIAFEDVDELLDDFGTRKKGFWLLRVIA